jgi:hypothetical protein
MHRAQGFPPMQEILCMSDKAYQSSQGRFDVGVGKSFPIMEFCAQKKSDTRCFIHFSRIRAIGLEKRQIIPAEAKTILFYKTRTRP